MTIISCYECGHTLMPNDERCASCSRAQILRGHFRITGRLGQGGFGIVFEALDQRVGRRCAVKQITTSSLAEQQRVVQEAKILARHAGSLDFIPDIYDIWNEDTSTYFVMEYISGDTLEKIVQRDGPWRAADVDRFLHTMLGYFTHMSAHDLVHRDIKPANIKRTSDDRYVLLDFGIAKHGNTTQTAHRGVYSPYFASPEQRQSQPTDRRSDLYSLGAVAYCLLTANTTTRVLLSCTHDSLSEGADDRTARNDDGTAAGSDAPGSGRHPGRPARLSRQLQPTVPAP